ncbi:hypothetical protein [Mycobacterium novum]
MSLLDRSNETVTVYPEEVTTDSDGNTFARPSATGIETRAWISPKLQSGTSARRAEQQVDGVVFTEQVYQLRFPRSWSLVLGAQSQIEWNGKRWSVFGNPVSHNGSARTRHSHYTIVRA